ncbi:MAG TPA: hypothetical protein DDY16_00930 [Tenacibaculum sp.]|nr:hypothetical protein [Tenacibaculum sp.]
MGRNAEAAKKKKKNERTSRKSMTWKFQPPNAPHFGGAHESLVRSTKPALYRALELQKKVLRLPSEDMLRAVLFEEAGLLNSRPSTYVSSDPQDLRPLIPNDLLNRPPIGHKPVSKEVTDTALLSISFGTYGQSNICHP